MYDDRVKKAGVAAVAVFVMGWAALAQAAAPQQLQDTAVHVNYEGLDIQSDAGARALYARLKSASKAACDFQIPGKSDSLLHYRKAKACYVQALDDAVASVQSEALRDLHAG